MLDYKLIEALAAVLHWGSFELAAQNLGLTQSAISQRIKLLEERMACPLLVRTKPIAATPTGQRLYQHYQQVTLLEHDLSDLAPEIENQAPYKHLPIAVNADSLATWFLPLTQHLYQEHQTLCHLNVADETKTLNLLRDGHVSIAISTQNKRIQGCKVLELGNMPYFAVATPNFVARFFDNGLTTASLLQAPVIRYNLDDLLPDNFLQKHFQLEVGTFPYHIIPSSEGYLQAILHHMGYGLVPYLQARPFLEEKTLVKLIADSIDRPLYLHYHNISSDFLKKITRKIKTYASVSLR